MSVKLIIALILLASMVHADMGTQTDWSGGPGQVDPVTEWTDTFLGSYLVNWEDAPGSVTLDQNALSHDVGFGIGLDVFWAKPCHLNNDSFPDVFVQYDDSRCRWWSNSAAGTVWFPVAVPDLDFDDIGTGDIDNDGHLDIVGARDLPTDEFVWLERLNFHGSEWAEHDISSGLYSCCEVRVIDFNGDGDLDIVGTYTDGSIPDIYFGIAWWENLGNGSDWDMHVIHEANDVPTIQSLDVADYDGDGDYDAVCGTFGGVINLFVNQGSDDGWELQVIEYQTEGSFLFVSFADVDGSGNEDLVTAANYYTGDVFWFEETSPGNWTPHLITSFPTAVSRAVPGDIDGDGDIDVAVSSDPEGPNPYYRMWYENLHGDASEWVLHPMISDEERCSHFLPADFNQDGRVDVLGSFSSSSQTPYNEVRWWDFTPGLYHTGNCFLESAILYVSDVHWNTIDWSATLPSQTSVKFQVRSSDDFTSMGDWSSYINSPGSIAPYVSDGDSYIQYRAVLQTTDSTATPTLNNVVIAWDPTGMEEGSPLPSEVVLNSPHPNPFSSSLSVSYSLPESMHVSLLVYDITGRLVGELENGILEAGEHSSVWDPGELPSGCYMVVLRIGESTYTETCVLAR